MELGSYVVIGAVVSLIVQYLKTNLRTSKNETLIAVLLISIVSGSVYYFIKDTSLWQPIISILGFAGAVYTYIIKRFE